MRSRSWTSAGAAALALVCAVAVLVPPVLDGLEIGRRIILGLGLVAAGVVLSRGGRVGRGSRSTSSVFGDRPR